MNNDPYVPLKPYFFLKIKKVTKFGIAEVGTLTSSFFSSNISHVFNWHAVG